MVHIKRVYQAYAPSDGFRVLIDRLWPRGVSKEKAHLDLWLKDIAPSTNLRKWFGHDPTKWHAFEEKYKQELAHKPEVVSQLKKLAKEHTVVTLVFGAKDTVHNDAVVLQGLLH